MERLSEKCRKMIKDVYNNISEATDKNTGTALFLFCIGAYFNNPLVECHFYQNVPLALIVKDGSDINKLFRLMRFNDYNEPILLSDAWKGITEQAEERSGDVAFFLYRIGKKATENLHKLIDAIESHSFATPDAHPWVVIIFEQTIPKPILGRCLATEVNHMAWNDNLQTQVDELKETLFSYASNNKVGVLNPILSCSHPKEHFAPDWMYAVASLAASILGKEALVESSVFQQTLYQAISELIQRSEDLQDNDGLAETFINHLKVVRATKAFNFYPISNSVFTPNSSIRRTVFYDQSFFYIKEESFQELCSGLSDLASAIQIKEALSNEDILVVERNGQRQPKYVTKVTVKDAEGKPYRERFHKLRKDFFDETTEESNQTSPNIAKESPSDFELFVHGRTQHKVITIPQHSQPPVKKDHGKPQSVKEVSASRPKIPFTINMTSRSANRKKVSTQKADANSCVPNSSDTKTHEGEENEQ